MLFKLTATYVINSMINAKNKQKILVLLES